MPVFQVTERVAESAAPPQKQPRRLSQEWSNVFRVVRSMTVAAGLFLIVLNVTGDSHYTFILLPVFLSVLIGNARYYNIIISFDGTPLYLLLTSIWALLYYGFIAGFVLLSHFSNPDPVVLVTTALAWAVILEPIRVFVQTWLADHYNVRNREALQAIENFTSTLREEVDLDALSERLLTVIQQALRPYSETLWIRLAAPTSDPLATPQTTQVNIADDDALLAYLLRSPGVTMLDPVSFDSPLLRDLKARRIELVLPFVNQRELLGLLALGPRLKEENYTRQDRALLMTLATQVAPAIRVAQLVQERQEQARQRERIEQELRTAQAIQQAFLPREVPTLPGWQLTPYYQPAREVGGDFYDFLLFEDGHVGIVVGDVTGKGVPAALVMATVHTMLRTATQAIQTPAAVLARVNDLLVAEIPPGMFVTCFFALLNPTSGLLRYANAGHEAPFRQNGGPASELWATGMPLGMLPGTSYDEYEAMLRQDERLLFYSDGLVEAHNSRREMFGFPRLQQLLTAHDHTTSLIDLLLDELKRFTGEGWEQEDDVTLVTLQRLLATPETSNEQHDSAALK